METIPTSEMPTQIALIILRFRIIYLFVLCDYSFGERIRRGPYRPG